MYVAGNIPEICRDYAVDKRAVDFLLLMVYLVDYPHAPRYGYLVADRRRLDHRAQLLRP